MANIDIRQLAKEKRVYLWEAADRLGMQDTNFSKKLRRELSDTEKCRVREVISTIAEERI